MEHTNPDGRKKRKTTSDNSAAGIAGSKRNPKFKEEVANRDRACVATSIHNRYGGMGTAIDNIWVGPGIEVAHILPWARPGLMVQTLRKLILAQRAKELEGLQRARGMPAAG